MGATLLARLEHVGAATIGQSPTASGLLSAVHLLGLTLLGGAVLVSGLRLLGVLLADRPVEDVSSATGRGVAVGLCLSVSSGLLMLAPRLSGTLANSIFQVKALLLVAAVAFHVGVYRRAIRGTRGTWVPAPLAGGVAIVLWLGVAAAGCALIIFE